MKSSFSISLSKIIQSSKSVLLIWYSNIIIIKPHPNLQIALWLKTCTVYRQSPNKSIKPNSKWYIHLTNRTDHHPLCYPTIRSNHLSNKFPNNSQSNSYNTLTTPNLCNSTATHRTVPLILTIWTIFQSNCPSKDLKRNNVSFTTNCQ